jgi:predicted hydrolase (HD superfamily)
MMLSREEALKFLEEKIANKNIIKHMLAAEAVMAGVYDCLKAKGAADLGGEKEEWAMAGLLHDGDYSEEVPVEKQGIQVTQWLKEKGHEVPANVAYTMAAHNWSNNGTEPKTLMDWALFCSDTLTGLIVACALVMPDKKLSSVKLESLLKKFASSSFAAGTRREDIKMCEGKLGIPLEEFTQIGLRAMQNISCELGL